MGFGRGQTSVDRSQGGKAGFGRPRDQNLRRSIKDFQRGCRKLASLGGDPPLASIRELYRNRRHRERDEDQRSGKRCCGARHQQPDGRYGDRPGDSRDEIGEQDAQPQVRQAVDIVDQSRQQVARPELGQTGRGEPLESKIGRASQPGEHPEGGVVAGQALRVAQRSAADAESPNACDRDHQVENGRSLGRPGDQPRGGGGQADRRSRGGNPGGHRQQQSAGDRPADPGHLPERRRATECAHAGSPDRASIVTTRSAIDSAAGLCATSITATPCS